MEETVSLARNGLMLMVSLFVMMVGLSSTDIARAETYNVFDHVEKASLTVNGKEITFPIGNVERKQDIFLLKKALGGDKDARELFLSGSQDKWFFVGTETPIWLHVMQNSEELVYPK